MLPALTLCAVAATSFVVPQARRARERISGVPRACQSQPEEPPFQVGQRVEGLYGASKLGVSANALRIVVTRLVSHDSVVVDVSSTVKPSNADSSETSRPTSHDPMAP